MTTPTIAGLTDRQKSIATLLWACESEDSLVQLIKNLPTEQDRADATSLVKIMLHECWETEHGLEHYEDLACEIIDRARSH